MKLVDLQNLLEENIYYHIGFPYFEDGYSWNWLYGDSPLKNVVQETSHLSDHTWALHITFPGLAVNFWKTEENVFSKWFSYTESKLSYCQWLELHCTITVINSVNN